ncbi:hypothetical protein SAMN05660349_02105 [Macellibacteroides fermentans]|uniref:Uncharacterized protein n=1 Tax=Parabacteroides chartae TaxID=1037355 RepID=A0A1T5CUH5_9BACT|nr:hypothetical protein SAMN05660349_02105 [Parabacteroides chartae]
MGRKTANSNELNNIYVLDSFYAKIVNQAERVKLFNQFRILIINNSKIVSQNIPKSKSILFLCQDL